MHLLQYTLAIAFAAQVSGCFAQNPALEELRRSAEQGDAEAQFNLGVRYYSGDGVVQDSKEQSTE